MSDSPKLCVPAYELLQALYHPEEAAKVYKEMTPDERQKTDYIMARLDSRKQSDASRDIVLTQTLPSSIVEENFVATHNICQYLRYLGYTPQAIPASVTFGVSTPVFVIEW